jgi:hypothetical protein
MDKHDVAHYIIAFAIAGALISAFVWLRGDISATIAQRTHSFGFSEEAPR